ncbi:MAG: GntR family transcriptional regulator [Desulfobacteraceae bacterium]
MGLSRIEKPQPLSKIALNALRNSILTSELVPGVIYNEKSLAERLGISRTPVREALLELATKRLIRLFPQKGVMINTFSDKDIEEVFDIRIALEALSIKKACGSNQLNVPILKQLINDQKAAVEMNHPSDFMEADRRFHMAFIYLNDNNYLIDTMQDIRDIMHLMGLRALGKQDRMPRVIREHETILEAVAVKDVTVAMEKIINHLEISKEAVKQNIIRKEDRNAETGNRVC